MLMRACDDPRLLASLRHNCAGPILTALEDPRFCNNGARVKNNALVEEIIIAWMQSHDWKDIKELLDKAGAPVSLVYTMEDIFEDPHYAARENLVEVNHQKFGTLRIPSVVPKLSKTPGEIKWIGADIGAYNDDVYSSLLGFSAEDIAKLRAEGTI